MPTNTMKDVAKTVIVAETQCACGAVSLALSGQPLARILCCCEDCQKISGTGHTALAAFTQDAIAVTGQTRAYTLEAASGAKTKRMFCPECGTPIYASPSRFPDLRIVPIGIFAQSDWYEPGSVIFHRGHQSWDVLPETISKYDTYKG